MEVDLPLPEERSGEYEMVRGKENKMILKDRCAASQTVKQNIRIFFGGAGRTGELDQ